MVQVALVESGADWASQIERVLTERGHAVARFASGAVALLRTRSGTHDLVIADVHAPGLDGVSLCKALREFMGRERMPVLLVTAESSAEDVLRALEAGANDCLLAPFSDGELRAKLASCLRARDATPPPTRIALREDLQRLPAAFGEYVLEEILGRGGFGAVFRARRRDGTNVALKMLHPALNDDRAALGRFFREVALLSRLECPHIVRVVDTGYELGRFYLAMPYLTGRTAERLLRERGPLPVAEAARIGLQVYEALSAMHSRGIVHRDVKPANIIVDARDHVMLVDLGLAKEVRDHGLTGSREIVGTVSYLAPEVVRGGGQEAASDLYSLGACLYELLAGVVPFRAPSTIGVLAKIVSKERPPALHERRAEVPLPLSALVQRLLDHDPAERAAAPVRESLRPLTGI